MKKWIISYCKTPTNYNDDHNAIVEAETAEDALVLLRDRLGEGNGVHNYVIGIPSEYNSPSVKGRIVSM